MATSRPTSPDVGGDDEGPPPMLAEAVGPARERLLFRRRQHPAPLIIPPQAPP